jgi:CO dehydrogenase maturation factor
MGRPEGPGCYCFANNALRAALKEIADNYPYIVIDNEAGLENLSRRIVREVDLMILVTDPSRQGLETIRRLFALAREMEIKFKRPAVVINRTRRPVAPETVARLQKETGACLVLALPDDDALSQIAESGNNLQALPASNPVVAGIDRLLAEVDVPSPARGKAVCF